MHYVIVCVYMHSLIFSFVGERLEDDSLMYNYTAVPFAV